MPSGKPKPSRSTGVLGTDSRLPRRDFIKTAVAAAAAGSLGAGSIGTGSIRAVAWGAPAVGTSAGAANPSEKAILALYESMSDEQRRAVCFDWDYRVDILYGRKPLTIPDPNGIVLRTHVSNAWLITPQLIGSPFYSDQQRELILEVMRTVLAAGWVEKLQQQARDDSGLPWGGDQALAIFGQPGSGTCQCAITGFHLTMRATSQPQPLAAFGGPITHGHQPSGFYEKVGHPGNIFWNQALRANDVYKLLDERQQRGALVSESVPFFQRQGMIDRTTIKPATPWDESRRESDIRFRRPGTDSPGLKVSQMGGEQRRALDAVLASLVEPYQQSYQDQVFDCLKRQGGLEQCSLAFYEDRDLGDDGQWDNWRLEGPSLVWFFRGSPHAHIWIHVASDPSAPMTSYFG